MPKQLKPSASVQGQISPGGTKIVEIGFEPVSPSKDDAARARRLEAKQQAELVDLFLGEQSPDKASADTGLDFDEAALAAKYGVGIDDSDDDSSDDEAYGAPPKRAGDDDDAREDEEERPGEGIGGEQGAFGG